MNFKEAAERCHVRAYIFRSENPNKKYAKNHNIPLKERVAEEDQIHDDWEEYDPEEDYIAG